MRFLGIDPGFGTIGLGLLESTSPGDLRVVEWLTILTEAGKSFPERLQEISQDLREYIKISTPDVAIVEQVFFSTNEKTALDVAQARGVILLCLQDAGVPIVQIGPLQMKLAVTGDGKADKRQVQDMIVRLLGLKEIPKPDDAADALGLAIYGAVTQPQRELMKKAI